MLSAAPPAAACRPLFRVSVVMRCGTEVDEPGTRVAGSQSGRSRWFAGNELLAVLSVPEATPPATRGRTVAALGFDAGGLFR